MLHAEGGAAGQLLLHGLKVPAAHNGRVVVPQPELLLRPVVGDLAVGEIVGGAVFFLEQVAGIFLVAEQPQHHGRGPAALGPEGRRHPRLGEFPGDGVGPLALLEEGAVHPADHLGLTRLRGEDPVQQAIAVDGVVAEHHPPAHGLELAPAGALRDLAGFLLRHAGHDGEAKFPVVVQGADVVVEEEYPHTRLLQTAGDLQGVHRVAGKAGYLLGENQIHLARHGLPDQAAELGTAPGAGARQPLVGIDPHTAPGRALAEIGRKKLTLGGQGIELILLVGGHTAVGGHPDGLLGEQKKLWIGHGAQPPFLKTEAAQTAPVPFIPARQGREPPGFRGRPQPKHYAGS